MSAAKLVVTTKVKTSRLVGKNECNPGNCVSSLTLEKSLSGSPYSSNTCVGRLQSPMLEDSKFSSIQDNEFQGMLREIERLNLFLFGASTTDDKQLQSRKDDPELNCHNIEELSTASEEIINSGKNCARGKENLNNNSHPSVEVIEKEHRVSDVNMQTNNSVTGSLAALKEALHDYSIVEKSIDNKVKGEKRRSETYFLSKVPYIEEYIDFGDARYDQKSIESILYENDIISYRCSGGSFSSQDSPRGITVLGTQDNIRHLRQTWPMHEFRRRSDEGMTTAFTDFRSINKPQDREKSVVVEAQDARDYRSNTRRLGQFSSHLSEVARDVIPQTEMMRILSTLNAVLSNALENYKTLQQMSNESLVSTMEEKENLRKKTSFTSNSHEDSVQLLKAPCKSTIDAKESYKRDRILGATCDRKANTVKSREVDFPAPSEIQNRESSTTLSSNVRSFNQKSNLSLHMTSKVDFQATLNSCVKSAENVKEEERPYAVGVVEKSASELSSNSEERSRKRKPNHRSDELRNRVGNGSRSTIENDKNSSVGDSCLNIFTNEDTPPRIDDIRLENISPSQQDSKQISHPSLPTIDKSQTSDHEMFSDLYINENKSQWLLSQSGLSPSKFSIKFGEPISCEVFQKAGGLWRIHLQGEDISSTKMQYVIPNRYETDSTYTTSKYTPLFATLGREFGFDFGVKDEGVRVSVNI